MQKLKQKKELEQFKEEKQEDNIIRLRDTRGNFYLGIRLPTKDYQPKASPIENNTISIKRVSKNV